MLKSFLKDGEAESYRGVKVTFVRGKKAIMHVYDEDGKEVETVELHTLKTKEALHALMREKGFQQEAIPQQEQKTVIDIPNKRSKQEQIDLEQRLLEKSILLGSNTKIWSGQGTNPVRGRQSVPIVCGLSSLVLVGIYFGRRRVLKSRSN